MKINLLVKIKISPSSNYVNIEDWMHESWLEENYQESIESTKKFRLSNKAETLEGYKLNYIAVEKITFDGRKKQPSNDDILDAMERDGLVAKKGDSIFGGFYLASEKLEILLSDQLERRKELISKGKFVTV